MIHNLNIVLFIHPMHNIYKFLSFKCCLLFTYLLTYRTRLSFFPQSTTTTDIPLYFSFFHADLAGSSDFFMWVWVLRRCWCRWWWYILYLCERPQLRTLHVEKIYIESGLADKKEFYLLGWGWIDGCVWWWWWGYTITFLSVLSTIKNVHVYTWTYMDYFTPPAKNIHQFLKCWWSWFDSLISIVLSI